MVRDFPIDLHVHTLASTHAFSTVDEYVRYAQKYNMQLIGISDHGPDMKDSPDVLHFWCLSFIPRVVEGIGILRGIEANIRRDGSLDIDKRTKKSIDYALAGFHNDVYPACNDIVKNTDILLKVISSNEVEAITHPGNKNYPIDYDEVCKVAKEFNVALEINGSSDVYTRKGSTSNCVKFARIASKVGAKLILGSDAHICYGLGDFKHCFEVIEQAEIDTSIIVNKDLPTLISFLEQRGRVVPQEIKSLIR